MRASFKEEGEMNQQEYDKQKAQLRAKMKADPNAFTDLLQKGAAQRCQAQHHNLKGFETVLRLF
jgi:hypothetical protein